MICSTETLKNVCKTWKTLLSAVKNGEKSTKKPPLSSTEDTKSTKKPAKNPENGTSVETPFSPKSTLSYKDVQN